MYFHFNAEWRLDCRIISWMMFQNYLFIGTLFWIYVKAGVVFIAFNSVTSLLEEWISPLCYNDGHSTDEATNLMKPFMAKFKMLGKPNVCKRYISIWCEGKLSRRLAEYPNGTNTVY